MVRRNPKGFYVYAYFEPGQQLPFYVGKGWGQRYRVHLMPCGQRRNTAMACKLRSLDQKGVRPDIKIAAQGLTEAAAFALEKHLIWVFGRRDTHTGCLTNHTDGGDGTSGYRPSDAARDKMRVAATGRLHSSDTKDRIRAARVGRSHSEDTRRKLRIAGLGKHPSDDTLRKMRVSRQMSAKVELANLAKAKPLVACSLDDGSRLMFRGSFEAERQGFNRSCISRALKSGRPYRGYTWKYKEADDEV